jgi:hypothetical protein
VRALRDALVRKFVRLGVNPSPKVGKLAAERVNIQIQHFATFFLSNLDSVACNGERDRRVKARRSDLRRRRSARCTSLDYAE